MTSFLSIYFCFKYETIFDPLSESNPLVESIMARKVYWGHVVSIFLKEILVDLVELHMVGFYIILGKDWL